MKTPPLFPAAALLTASLTGQAAAQFLTGFGFYPYEPLCAESCLRSLSSYTLACTTPTQDHSGHDHSSSTSPECYASDTPFLTSVAWCFSTKCAAESNIPVSTLQLFWEKFVTGTSKVSAKWSYETALANVSPKPPTYQLGDADTGLNVTSIVPPDTYLAQWNVLGMVARENYVESKFSNGARSSITIFSAAVGIPIALSCLSRLPYAGVVLDKVKPYLVYPALIGRYQVRPLPLLLGNAPTTGQGLYIALFIVLNVVLAAVDYQSGQPNGWFGSQWKEISAYVLYRTGTFGFMLMPLLFLFASRNNVLLWLSNWSHSTYLLLHRWVARVFALYVVIHSIIGLQIYAHYAQTEWWIWGAVATIATVLLAIGSGLYVRASQYELFLVSHVVLSVFVVVGCWYHIFGWYASMGIYLPSTWGYEVWVFFGIAVWFFDRLVRVGRVLKNGAPRAQVFDLGNGYLRVDIAGIRWGLSPGQHVYVYFPTLAPLRPWENHPFSIIPTQILGQSSATTTPHKGDLEKQDKDSEGQKATISASTSSASDTGVVGITLFIKKSTGITKHLQASESLLTLLDGPYSNCHKGSILRCDRLLLLGGGIGITGLLAWAQQHWNVKLVWSVAESARCLVDAINLATVAENEVRVGSRFNFAELIQAEASAGWGRVGVVVSGPGGLCDDVRAAVAAVGRRSKTVFELEVDAYSW
ncbi:hypothetical protein B0T14DRAFT_563702 [Immersiella caudata]|uniref:FAD-binding FR-type domain-containing protein n=1 Tax=Immersiella caudata TaxID=314043 RepID=A0AA40C8B8_9PEZI|nr:hypothetical protein B0T14DRAFT_563702 [Immersiella caudata]